jgi:hypothetical protein
MFCSLGNYYNSLQRNYKPRNRPCKSFPRFGTKMDATKTVKIKIYYLKVVGHNLIAKDEGTVQDGEGYMGDIAIDNADDGDEAMGMVMVVMMMVMMVVILVMDGNCGTGNDDNDVGDVGNGFVDSDVMMLMMVLVMMIMMVMVRITGAGNWGVGDGTGDCCRGGAKAGTGTGDAPDPEVLVY